MAFVNQLTSVIIPNKLEEALKDKKWIEAMEIEMDALKQNQTRKL
jgi:galactitol-specific phosphotransferase system IIB component